MAGLMPKMAGSAMGRMGNEMPENMPPPSGDQGGSEAPGEDEGAMGEGGNMASPEEQAIYDKFIGKCMTLIYSKMYDQVTQMLQGKDPVDALAQTAAMVIFRVIELAVKSGQALTMDVMLHAGQEVFEDLADLSTKLGVHDFQADQKSTEAALYRTMDYVRVHMQESGLINQDKMKQLLGALQQMDQDGQLGTGLKKLSGAAPAPDQNQTPQGGMPEEE